MTATIYEIDPSVPTPDELRLDPSLSADADHKYNTLKAGPRTILPCSFAYLPFSHSMSKQTSVDIAGRSQVDSPQDRPMLQRLLDGAKLGQDEYIFDVGNWSPFWAAEKGQKYATMLQILQLPFSKGCVHVRVKENQDTMEAPNIDLKYYSGHNGSQDLYNAVSFFSGPVACALEL